MTDLDFERELKKERLKGRYSVIVAVIAAVATIIAAIIGVSVKKENAALQEGNMELRIVVENLQAKISELNDIISFLRTTNEESGDENSTLQKQFNALQDENSKLKQELHELKSGTPIDDEPALYERIAKLEEEKSRLMEELRSSHSDNDSSNDAFEYSSHELLTVCTPYEPFTGYEAPEIISIMGIEYKNAFSLRDYGETAYVNFNLQAKYQILSFDVGLVDGEKESERTLNIYLNGNPSKAISLKPGTLTHYDIQVKDVQQLKFEIIDENWDDPRYGFVNVTLS